MNRLLEDFIDNIDSDEMQTKEVEPDKQIKDLQFEIVCDLNMPHLQNNMVETDRKNIEHYLEQNPFVDDFTDPEDFWGTDFGLRFNANFHFNRPIQIIRFLYGLEKFGVFKIEIKKSGFDALYKVTEFSFMRAVCTGHIQDEKNKRNM
jgi:hypothetical protein